ncbi:MAG TPA: hypothetical protein VIU33_00050 [Nitrospiria bacterium]
MNEPVSEDHPLRKLFASLTEKTFAENLKWADPNVSGYLANLLVDFSDIERLYRIRDGKGMQLQEVSAMLLESDFLLNAGSVEREREVHRHIGDFTLFMVGLFPEFLKRIKLNKLIHHPDFLLDYVKVGKTSYRNVSEFNYGEFRESVPLFRKLSENFEVCVMGLGCVRESLKRMARPNLQLAGEILLN